MNARTWVKYLWQRAILRVQLEPRATLFWAVVLLAGLSAVAGSVLAAGGH